MNFDARTIATIGGIGLGTGLAYMFSRSRRPRSRWTDMRHRSRKSPQWTGNWTPASRFLAGLAGGALSYYGMRRPGVAGKAMATAGLGLLTRGATNQATRGMFGMVPMIAGLRR
jgi:hypothetical protein